MKITLVIVSLLASLSLWAAKVEVEINGMTCAMCIESITRELKAIDKVENITVNLEDKKATFDEIKGKKISDGEIRTAVKKAGYDIGKVRRQ
jgi:copper chaperone CopZ